MEFQIFQIEEPRTKFHVKSAAEVFGYLKQYAKASREVFLGLYFNAQNRLIEAVPLCLGTVDTAVVWPREIVRTAIHFNASSVILAHNHPSGDVSPSQPDKEMTRSVVWACSLLEIKVLDHIIIGHEKYYSFADVGAIEIYNKAIEAECKQRGMA